MGQDAVAWLTGSLLVAMPGIEDPRFERAVVLVCAHDSDHAMGLTVNRPVEGLTVSKLLARLKVKAPAKPIEDLVLVGGPVAQERGFVLHTDDYAGEPTSVAVGAGVALTATREVLEALSAGEPHPRKAVMALGYAGWDGGQLEREIRHNVWLTCDADESLLFGDDHAHKWSRALAKIGVAAERLSGQTGQA
ncbi:MAG TPA: YqgE/AlgH family protein [Caulobacteraceae bacterium]|nr:YqgE/AlgH family protein [Caulobacteraceae bacterium]